MAKHVDKNVLAEVLASIMANDSELEDLVQLVNNKVNRSGDTMTGPLRLTYEIDNSNTACLVCMNKITENLTRKIYLSLQESNEYPVVFTVEKNGAVINRLAFKDDSTILGKPLTVASGGTGTTTFHGPTGLIHNMFTDSDPSHQMVHIPVFGPSWNTSGYTTIGQILNDWLTTRQVDATINKAPHNAVQVTAPTVSGYTFVCWLQPSTTGWVGACYMENPTQATNSVWVGHSTETSGTGNVRCTALYRKNY